MWRASSALVLGLLWPQDAPESAAALMKRADAGALLRTWKFKGVMHCTVGGLPLACIRVENAFPCGLIEVVQRPGASQVFEAQSVVSSVHAGSRHSEGNLRFAEARVHTAVPLPPDFILPVARPPAMGYRLNYVSEFDRIGWRTAWWDLLLRAARVPASCERWPNQPGCAGRWGAMYPRTGFAVHASEPMAAFLQAVRAGRVASDPAGRVVLEPYLFEPRPGHYLQMIKPVWRPAVPIGPPGALDRGAGSTTGSYLFIHLGIFEECRGCLPPRLVGPR
ncbi:MAG: hypothetical protein HY716_17570 [Planctomycetes bacterium]|nr:hypothetical protein [Planctomycetota bacterium]